MNIKSKQIFELTSVLLVILLITILFVMLFPYISSSSAAVPVKILFELSPYILMVGLIVVVCKLKERPIFTSLGFQKSHITKQFLIGVIIFAITISFIVIPLLCGVDKSNVLGFKPRSPLILIYYMVKSMVFVGMGEELIWRGYFYERLKKLTTSGPWAVVISSVLFGLWHYPNGQNLLQVLMISGIGLIYGFARLKIEDCSVMATGIAHGLHDAVIVLLSYILM